MNRVSLRLRQVPGRQGLCPPGPSLYHERYFRITYTSTGPIRTPLSFPTVGPSPSSPG